MRSSRALRAEAAGKIEAKMRAMTKKERGAIVRRRVIPCAAPASRRGRAETYLGCFPLSRRGNFKEFARLESQHVRENIRGELLNLGVQVANYGVVIASRVLDGVLDLGE